MNRVRRIGLALLLLFVLWIVPSGNGLTHAQITSAETLLAQMSPAERIGQLFLVTFTGDTAVAESDITDLILNYHVGGVVLLAKNDNLTGYGDPANTPQQIAELTNILQQLAITNNLPIAAGDEEGIENEPNNQVVTGGETAVPLLVVMNLGNSRNENGLAAGFTPIPSQMAIGATWNPDYAARIGEVIGQELAAAGVNMVLGPALDVLENPNPSFANSELGTNTFGGDPYWVGQMGKAYISGIHQGSTNRVAVVAKHFPGKGSSDRPISEEIPTVRKSLEQLKQIELAPFVDVTNGQEPLPEPVAEGSLPDPGIADALLTTHIRYQGFQGNIRATTAPVSFDSQALTSLLELPQFANWRQQGGIIVSDSLGVRSVERFFDDTGSRFPHRRVAIEAFQAGNDLLYLDDFGLEGAPFSEQLANIKDTISWFNDKYNTDVAFQQQVDAAVLRILQLKLELYGNNFDLENVAVGETAVADQIKQYESDIFEIAQAAVTLISPSQEELAERLASPPGPNDRIIIFSDVRPSQQCSNCPASAPLSETAFEERLLARYGPSASGQLLPSQIESYSFNDLQAFLDAPPGPILAPQDIILPTSTPNSEGEILPEPTPTTSPSFFVQESLKNVDWIIFGMLDGAEESQALNRFLAERPDFARNSKVVVFAFDAPFYLDTTEISKLTAYFGVYSPQDVFVDAAVRALFQEFSLTGASPISIEGISYDLFQQMRPNPQQVIELYIDVEDSLQSPSSEAPLDTAVGETLHLQTGVIQDRNGNPVPDGTIVRFIQEDRVQGLINIIEETDTQGGVAQLDYVLEARTGQGQFRITAETDEVKNSWEVDFATEGEAQVAIIIPTIEPTSTTTPLPTATVTATAVPSSTPTSVPATSAPATPPESVEPAVRIELSEFRMLLSMLTGITIAIVGTFIFSKSSALNAHKLLNLLLWVIAGGLLLYIYYLLGLPGTAVFQSLGSWAGLLSTLLGGGFVFLIHYIRRT